MGNWPNGRSPPGYSGWMMSQLYELQLLQHPASNQTDCSPWEQSGGSHLGHRTFCEATPCLPASLRYKLDRARACCNAIRHCSKTKGAYCHGGHRGSKLQSSAPVLPGGSKAPGAQRDPTLGSYLRAQRMPSFWRLRDTQLSLVQQSISRAKVVCACSSCPIKKQCADPYFKEPLTGINRKVVFYTSLL